MKKKIIIAGIIIVVLIGIALLGLLHLFSKPMYEIGMVKENATNLFEEVVQDIDENTWLVEKNISIHHFNQGTGEPVLFIHGGPGMPLNKPPEGLDFLNDRFQVHFYHQRGCGKSSRPIDRFENSNFYENAKKLEKTLGFTAQIADIERIRQHLNIRKITLIGHSFGALIASLYAAEFPENIKSLVLIAPASVLVLPQENTGLFADVEKRLPEELRAEYKEYLDRYLDFGGIFEKSESDLVKLNSMFVKFYKAALRAEGKTLPESQKDDLEFGGWMVQAMYFSMGQKHDYRQNLKAVSAPVLVIHGADDLQSEIESRMYAESFPNATFEVIQGAGHFAFSEQPQKFAKVVAKFLD